MNSIHKFDVKNFSKIEVDKGFEGKLLAFVQILQKTCNSLWIYDESTYWLYHTFLAVLFAARRGIKVFLITVPSNDEHEKYRRWLLRKLGAIIYEIEKIPFSGFLFDPEQDVYIALLSSKQGIVGTDFNYSEEEFTIYSSKSLKNPTNDLQSLLCNWQELKGNMSFDISNRFSFQVCQEEDIFERLRYIPQYKYSGFSLQNVDINDLFVVQIYVKKYKLIQINQLIDDFQNFGIDLFLPQKVVFDDLSYSIITPPVLERIGRFVVIEGNTRAFYCLRNSYPKMKAIVVDNVKEPLPGQPISILNVQLCSNTLPLNRLIQNLDYKQFREIEKIIHLS